MTHTANDTAVIDREVLAELARVAEDFAQASDARVRDLHAGGAAFDRAVWHQIADLGWLGLALPESIGGSGANEHAVAIIAEKLGAGAVPAPYVMSGAMVAALLAQLVEGGDDRAQSVLTDVLAGKLLLTVGGAMSVEATPGIVGRSVPGGISLSGEVRWVQVADADGFLLLALDAERTPVVALVARDADGLSVSRRTLADGTVAADLRLADVLVEEASVLGVGSVVSDAVREAVGAAMTASSAELLGVGDRALAISLEYIGIREQFGRPIGSFQVLRHRAVDMYMHLRVARAALNTALDLRADPAADRVVREAQALAAQSRASSAVSLICRSAVQLHGALGFTAEYDLGYYVNRMLVLSSWLGNASEQARRYFAMVGHDLSAEFAV